MPEETKKDKSDDKKGDAKFRDLEPTKDAKGGGGLKPASGGGGGSSNILPVPPTPTNN